MSQFDQFSIEDLFCKVVRITISSPRNDSSLQDYLAGWKFKGLLFIYSANIYKICIQYDPGAVPGQCPCCPGVHSLEAGDRDRYTVDFVMSTAEALWGRVIAEFRGGCPTLPMGAERTSQSRVFAQSWGMNNSQGTKERKTTWGDERCCRHEPVPLILQR